MIRGTLLDWDILGCNIGTNMRLREVDGIGGYKQAQIYFDKNEKDKDIIITEHLWKNIEKK